MRILCNSLLISGPEQFKMAKELKPVSFLMANSYESMEWRGMADYARKMGASPNDDDSDRYGNTTINY